jgi:hypothetical protein
MPSDCSYVSTWLLEQCRFRKMMVRVLGWARVNVLKNAGQELSRAEDLGSRTNPGSERKAAVVRLDIVIVPYFSVAVVLSLPYQDRMLLVFNLEQVESCSKPIPQ